MHRPSAARRTARDYANIMYKAGTSALAIAGGALLGALVSAGIYEQAMRENRQRSRSDKRHRYHTAHFAAGLNGNRAVARRLRQIQRGSLRSENGLCAA